MTKAVCKPVAMVAINYPPGFTESTFAIVKSLVHGARAAYVEYVPTTTWIVCFKPNKGSLAKSLVSKVHELRGRDPRFAAMGAAAHTGTVVYYTDLWGRVRSGPLGDHANLVLRVAAADAARHVSEALDKGGSG